jgi:hypothetical protein
MTITSEKAIDKEANIGLRNPKAAKGIATMLYANAQNKFCLIVFNVSLDKGIKQPLVHPIHFCLAR